MTRSSNGGNYPRGAAISAHGLSCGSSVLIPEDASMGRAVRRLLDRQNRRALGKLAAKSKAAKPGKAKRPAVPAQKQSAIGANPDSQ